MPLCSSVPLCVHEVSLRHLHAGLRAMRVDESSSAEVPLDSCCFARDYFNVLDHILFGYNAGAEGRDEAAALKSVTVVTMRPATRRVCAPVSSTFLFLNIWSLFGVVSQRSNARAIESIRKQHVERSTVDQI